MGGISRSRGKRQASQQGAGIVSAVLKNADVFKTGKGGPNGPPAIIEIKAGPNAHKADLDRKLKDLVRLSDEGKLSKKKPGDRLVRDQNGKIRRNKKGDPLTRTSVFRERMIRRLERNDASKKANRSLINKLYAGKGSPDVGKGVDPDHVHELQLNGLDEYDNLRLMDSKTNRTIGSVINGALRDVPDGTPVIIRVV
jgi:hypothetical protein